MKTKIKKLMLTIVLVLSAVVLSPAQIVYKKTLRTDGGDISITECAVNTRPYDNENLQRTRILAKNGTEFAITFPESYENLSIVRNNRRIEVQGRKIVGKEPGDLSFKFTYIENGVSYTCDVEGDVNYYGELRYQGRSNLRDNPIIVTNANKNDHLTIPQAFTGLEWLLYRNVFDNDQKTIDYDKLAECQNTAFSRKRVISFEELLTLKSDQIVGGKLELLLLLQDHTSNALSNGVPGGTSVQAITLVDARTYNLSLSQVGQGTVSASKNQLKPGENATLTAQAAQGWRFDHWEENAQNLGATNPLTVTMGSQDRSIKAVFKEKARVTLQIVDTNGRELAQSQSQEVTSGGSITFQVPNLANVNFKGWKRNGQIVETGNTYMLSNVTQNETIQAVFEVPVQSLSLSFTELNLKVGESKPLPSVTVIPSNATDQTITWVSNDPGIAKIENGKVVGVSAGSVDLVASSSNQKKATLKVVVAELPRFIVTLQIVDTKGQKLAEPQQREVTSGGNVVFQTPNVPNANFKGWKRNGQIVETGSSYTLSNLTQNETIQAVFEVPVQSITVAPPSITAKVGDGPVQLTATVLPSNATSRTVTWTSKNEQVVTVDSNGKVTIIGVGETTIEAKAGEKTFTVQVKIEAQPQQPQQPQVVPVQSITVTPASITAKVGEGPVELTATVLPSNATSRTVTWLSKNEQVVTVDSNGKVTIIGAGETTIEAKAGEKTFTVQVKIEAQPQQPQQPQVVPVQSITVTPASITAKVGEGPVELTATVLPSNATSRTVTWLSKNEQVVTVDSNGKVTIIGAGETTIEAKAGEKTFTVQVKIEAQPQQPQESDFPPYTVNLQTFKVNQTVDASKVVWENFPQGLDKTAIKYSLRDFNGVDISNNKQIFEVNGQNLTFKKIGSYFLIATLRDNQNNEIRIDLTIQVNE